MDLGFHDASFTFNTLDGAYNGGQTFGWYFWPKVVAASQTEFWKTHAMGGEVRYAVIGFTSHVRLAILLINLSCRFSLIDTARESSHCL